MNKLTREEILAKWDKASLTRKSIWVSEIILEQPVKRVDWIGNFVTDTTTGREYQLPLYADDISAAWRVEERIKQLNHEMGPMMTAYYMTELLLIVGNNGFDMVHATPEQRCKAALLAVLGEEEAK